MNHKQKIIQEGNFKIALFMQLNGVSFDGSPHKWSDPTKKGESCDDLKYHESWDWLMPVVKKAFDSLVGNTEDWTFLIEKRIKDSILLIDIEQTWMYVVEFAKKHNEKNEK